MELWTDYSMQIIAVTPLLILVLLYCLRRHAHHLLQRLARSLHRLLRLAARGCLRAEQRIRLRNHEVTKALAESLLERQLERRFMRIERLVERDLDNYQKLSAQINQQVATISEDYESSGEVPTPSPEWISAVEAIAMLEGDQRNSEVMARILGDIHGTVKEHQREALREHRWTVAARHKVLARLRPQWRRLVKLLDHIDRNIEILRQRLRQVDKHMGQFELLTAGSGQGIMASMFMRFAIALSFVALGVAAAWVNVQLLQQPLTGVLSKQVVEGLPMATLIGVMHIGVTLVAAALITESLRVTHLLPLAGAMNRNGRSMLMWMGSTLLLLTLILESTALLGIGPGENAADVADLPSVLLAGTALITSLVVAVSIIPLEYLLHTIRPVVGSFLQVLLHLMAMATRLLASLAVDAGRTAVILYDVVIFLPLMIEGAIQKNRKPVEALPQNSREEPAYPPAARNVTALRFRGRGAGSSPE